MQTDDNQRMCQLKSVETETRNRMRLFQIKFCFVIPLNDLNSKSKENL